MRLLQFLAIFSVAVWYVVPAFSQRNSQSQWNKGLVLLLDESEHTGNVRYDLQNNSVQVSSDGKMLSFSASKVEYFEIYDAEKRETRLFYSLPYSQNNNYEALFFFELMTEGKLTLLNREKLVERVVNRPFAFGFPGSVYTEYYWVDEFYLMKEDGKVFPFDPENESIFEHFDKQKREVNDFIHANKGTVKNRFDLIRVIAEYNKLFAQ